MGFDGATVMILILLLLAVVLVLVFLRYVPLGLWVRALSSGVKSRYPRSSACVCAAFRPIVWWIR